MLWADNRKALPLRPHHGMCMAYFQGSGYSESFTRHMQEVLELLETDIRVKLTVAVDEVCSACPNNQEGACKDSALVERYDRAVLERCGLMEGQELTFHEFTSLVYKHILIPGRRPEICGGCQWDEICGRSNIRPIF